MQFWIIKDGESVGPYSLDEFKNLGIDKNTKIWYPDLKEWTPAGETAVANELFAETETGIQPEIQQPDCQQQEEPEQPKAEPESEPEPMPTEQKAQPPVFHRQPQATPPQFCQPEFHLGDRDQFYQGYQKGLEEGKRLDKDTDTSRCPDNYLVWAILSTVLCCLPLGVVAIVYSSQVSKFYAQGEFLKAQKASEKSLYWSLASAIVWMVTYPIVSALSLFIV